MSHLRIESECKLISNLFIMKLKNYFRIKSRQNTCLASSRIYFTVAAMLSASALMAQTPELVSDDAKDPMYLTEFNGELFFNATAQDDKQWLWNTDGTTTEIRGGSMPNSHPGSQPKELIVFNDQLFLSSVYKEGADWNREIFTYIGITDQLKLLKNIRNGGASDPTGFTELDGSLYFSADDGTNGRELWVTDGSEGGTQLFKNISPGSGNSIPNGFVNYGDNLIFRARNGADGMELWITDGTSNGTEMVKDIYSGSTSGTPFEFTEFDEKIYFRASDDAAGLELWATDGTEYGTSMVKDIDTDDLNLGGEPRGFKVYNEKLYFSANNGINGTELWVSDGTGGGTEMFRDLKSGPNDGSPNGFTIYENKLYFSSYSGDTDKGLWVTDGTDEGTYVIKMTSGKPSNLFTYDDRLYFVAEDDSNGGQLWVSDGTDEGTEVIAPTIAPNNNPIASSEFEYAVVDGTLYYTANYDGSSMKLYQLTTDNLSVDDYEQNEFVAYPNPVQDVLHLETNTDNIQKIDLFSISGQRLQTWEGQSEIDLSSLTSGNYFVKITTSDDQTMVEQIIKK